MFSRFVARRARIGIVLAYLAAAFAFSAARADDTLSFAEALRIGEQISARLEAQGAALAAADALVPRAGELPDPKLQFGIENLPADGADRYRIGADFMTMRRIGLVQEFPNGEKRRLRGERAARERDLEAAGLAAQRVGVRRDIALAWFDLYFARKSRDALVELVRDFELQLDTVSAAVASGRQTGADAIALRSMLENTRDRVIEQERTIARARYALAVWLREAAALPLADPPDTATLDHPPQVLLGDMKEHPQLRLLDQREALADTDVALAANSKKPDWSVQVSYAQRGPEFSNMLSVMVSVDLPWETAKRQDRDLAAKRLLADQVRAQAEDSRRAYEAELLGVYADWQTATKRTERFGSVLLPLADERVQAALAAYRGGRGELGAVLDARRAATETRLAAVQVELERARAWAKLNFLLPHGGKP